MVESVFRLTDRQRIVALTAAVALLHGASMLHAGVRVSSDSGLYASWADVLVSRHFNVAAFLRQTTFVVPPVLYVGWISIVAAAKLLLGSSWAAGIVALNWAAFAATVYLTLVTVHASTRSNASLLLAAVLFAVAIDFLIIEPFVLSDLLFVALSTCVMAAAVRARPPSLWFGTCCVVAACVVRPTAAPLVVFWLLAAFVRDRAITTKQLRSGLLVAGALTVAAVLADAFLMMRPEAWPLTTASGWIQQLSREYHRGVVVFDRPGTFVAPPERYGGFVALTLWKWLYYFAPFASEYSAAHKAVNALFFAPLFGFTAAAIAVSRERRIAALLVFYVLAFSVFHAVQQIDFDYRYRLPVLPALIVMAGIGFASVRPGRRA